MTLTEFSIKRKTVSWMTALLLLGGGIISFLDLGRLEDPEFTIKEAVIVTAYPGASALEVEEEVTLPIENALQQLAAVDNVRSISSSGLSQVMVEMKSTYRDADLAQVWDEMRRKVYDMQTTLPPGVQTPEINDDFGDVYGMFMAVTGQGFSYEELADYVDFLRRELVLVDGVGKVAIGGRRDEEIVLEANRAKMAASGISATALQALLQNQNMVSDAGRIAVGSEYIRISSTGTYDQVSELGNLMLGQARGEIVYLGDVVSISRSYADPPSHIYRFNGEPALTLGISFGSGVNVVEVGKAVTARLTELDSERPIGMTIHSIYSQPAQVDSSVQDFLLSLAQALGIVVVVLLIAMGPRSGVLMSGVLALTILATFIVMNVAGIELHRVSLGALVIALGMLVDNAIVITEGILIGLKRGLSRLQAAKNIVSQTVWPLLGATVISVTAFAPIGLSPEASGEFTGSLFWVLFISLMISWLIAITLTPFFATLLFKENPVTSLTGATDPYKGIFYQVYKAVLLLTLRYRISTMATMGLALGFAIYGFGFVNQAFFPPTTLPVFTVDYWLAEGSDIRRTAQDMAVIERELLKHPDITKISSTVGQGNMRFMLTYNAERSYDSYGQFLVEVTDFEKVAPTRRWVDAKIAELTPHAFSKSERIFIGTAMKAKVEARITGPDPDVLRKLAADVVDIFRDDSDAINIRHDWRERTKVLRPQFAEDDARRLGISRADLDNAIAMNVSGVPVGLLRDGSTLLPIVLRQPVTERSSVSQLGNIQIYSPALQAYVSIDQVVEGIDLAWEDPLIMRRDRKRTIQIWADPNPLGDSNSFALFERLRPQVEALELPDGYSLEWGGEYESQRDANTAVFRFVPVGVLVMVAITVLLFNSFRQTIVVWLTVPLANIGVTVGLLTFNEPFSFTAVLGFLSLSGMLLKNGIVLVEEIKRINEDEGEPMHDAITQAAVSRLRPVVMAAITTVLGLIPLLSDVFFAPLAVTIMFGLAFGTILTLIVVPVLFALFYRVQYHRGEL